MNKLKIAEYKKFQCSFDENYHIISWCENFPIPTEEQWQLWKIELLKLEYKKLIASHRWEIETSGVEIILQDGRIFKVNSDSDSQSKLTGTLIALQVGAVSSVGWKSIDKGFQVLNSSELQSVWGQVLLHIQNCFAREAELLELLENTPNDELENLIPIIEQFWPD